MHKVILGIDFGLKCIGIAAGQTITKTATPVEIIANGEAGPNWNRLNHLIVDWRADALVVGVPLHRDGSSSELTELAAAFAAELRAHFDLPVYEIDEYMTTQDAKKILAQQSKKKSNSRSDSIAAMLIVTTWMREFT